MNKFRKHILVLSILTTACAGGITGPSYASLDKGLEKSIAEGSSDFMDVKAIRAFYEARDSKPVWAKGDYAEDALELLEESWTHGLNPENYHAGEIQKLLDAPFGARKARLELLLTDGVLRYVRDMTGIRVRAEDLRLKSRFWRQPQEASVILENIHGAKNPVRAMESVIPRGKLYDAMREELIRLSRDTNNYDHLLPLDFGGGLFQPGKNGRDVPKLRERLGVEYKEGQGPETYYDDTLAAAVMKFQAQYGLEPDGIIGSQTLDKLNQTHRAKMEQIVANLERARWLDEEKPERYVLVNIPSQKAWAIENGRTQFEMDVVVGMPVRQTRQFHAEIRGVRFNPTWTVPQGIKMADFLPKLKEDPSYLIEKGIEVRRGYGSESVTLDPMEVDWHSMGAKDMAKIRLIQSPGDHNALGRVRILMDNEYDIYMHDTNHPEFFERTQRTYSSGCIRLKEPEKMASFVLRHNKGWSDEKMHALIEAGRMVEVPADTKLPVYILYQSVWLGDDGELVYGADVYGQDKKLVNLLRENSGFSFPKQAHRRIADKHDKVAVNP